MLRKNKKAWMRVVEAFIALVIISSALVIVTVSTRPQLDKELEIHKIQRAVLLQIENNNSLREKVIAEPPVLENLEEFIQDVLPLNLDFSIRICDVDEICGMLEYVEKDVYADEVLISSTLQIYNPKKLKFFVWVK